MADLIYLSNVRLSFPQIVEPKAFNNEANGVKKYSADFLMDQTDPSFAQFMQLYANLATEKWKENASAIMQMIQADRKLRCYGSGNERVNKKTFKPYDGYENKVFVTAITENKPQMIQADGNGVDPTNTMAYMALARKLYGGCYVNAAVKPWVQDNNFGRGIRCDLIAIQFQADGDSFGEGNVDATPMFGAVAGATPAAPSLANVFPLFLGGNQ